jgi:hypothetical protein
MNQPENHTGKIQTKNGMDVMPLGPTLKLYLLISMIGNAKMADECPVWWDQE